MFHILKPGLQTTIQDLGRFGLGDQGISPAGPMDALALRLGNLIVGNSPNAAALEMTLVGTMLAMKTEGVIALAGAPFEATIEHAAMKMPCPPWQAVRVQAGDQLVIGAAQTGMRTYLCVAGGIDTLPVMGSRATHLMAGLGGLDGRALQVGDYIEVGQPAQPLTALVGRRLKRSLWPPVADEPTVRVILGPQTDRFTEAAQATFLSQPYTVAPDSNRMGVRLNDSPLVHVRGADLVSEGIALGAIQVPQSGQPIILMVERQTTGGYTKIATVIGADVRLVGQARPGSRLRFMAVSVAEALAARRAQEELVDETNIEQADAWGPAEVIAVMEAFAASNLGEIKLKAGGVRLRLRRDVTGVRVQSSKKMADPSPNPLPEGEGARADGNQAVEVVAPLLGVFYAAASPEEPPFVQVGDRVEVGQVVALIDVMKTLHEVRATQAGRVKTILVENGALVEYGQPLLQLEV